MEQKKDFLEELAKNIMLAALLIAGVCTLCSFAFQFINKDTATLFTQLSFYAYGWMVFLSLGPAMKHSQFMKIELLTSALYPESVQKTLKVVCDAIMAVLVAINFVFSIQIFGGALANSDMNAAAPVIPVALAYLASVIGYGLGLIAYIMRMVSGKGGNR